MKTTKGCHTKHKRDPKSGKSQIPVRSGSTFKWRIQQRGSKDDGDGGSHRKPALKRHQLQVTRTQGRRRDNLSASRPVGSEISFVTFAETTKPYTIENAVQYLTHIRDSFYPTEVCVRHTAVDRSLYLFLFSDPLYFHAIQFAVLAYKEMLLGLPRSNETYRHGTQTFQLLRQRLSSPDQLVALSDPTALAIITLAHAAEGSGDTKSFEAHVQGLRALVEARGGLTSLKSDLREMRTKICRVDSAFAFLEDRPPMFFKESISWDRYLVDQDEPLDTGPLSIQLQKIRLLEPRLVNVWLDMRQFALMCNRNQKSNTRIDQSTYGKITVSMQYRLLHLSFAECSLNNALRMGLLVVMTKLMFGWHPNNKAQRRALVRFEVALLQLRSAVEDVPCPLLFWMIMLRFQFGVPETAETWLEAWFADVIKELPISSWSEAKTFLVSMVWFDFFGDLDARIAFEAACSRNQLSD
ncbi:unnamed protein product [Clonostachys rosea f. rosea IK726]|uniref:Transcription factor domain-containing protein n=2 Tax=Bionectria ochroleuca TaxID=29856 RepID=A0A0B7JV16_BIOOC|nr:unnamed protein product [Clonostachys rosea f. rosea IK726]